MLSSFLEDEQLSLERLTTDERGLKRVDTDQEGREAKKNQNFLIRADSRFFSVNLWLILLQQRPEHILQNSAVFVIVDFIRGINPANDVEHLR